MEVKKLNFDIKNFKDFKNKIEYIVVKDQPKNLLREDSSDNKSILSEKKIINSLLRELSKKSNHSRNKNRTKKILL